MLKSTRECYNIRKLFLKNALAWSFFFAMKQLNVSHSVANIPKDAPDGVSMFPNLSFPNLSLIFWSTHLMVLVILVQSSVNSVNDLYFIKQNSNRSNLENIVLKTTVYAPEIHFL